MRYIKIFPLALLMTTTFYKAAFNLPFDITFAAAAILVLAVIYEYIKHRFTLNKSVLLILFMFLSVIPFIPFAALTGYAGDKSLYWFTLTLLAAIAPTFVVRNASDLKCLEYSIIGLLSFNVVYATIAFIQNPDVIRLDPLGNTIALGMAGGILFLYIFILLLYKRFKYLFAVPLLCVLIFITLSSGAKGAILFMGLTALIIFFIFRWKHKFKKSFTIGVIGIALVVFLSFSADIIPQLSFDRVTGFLKGESSASTKVRMVSYTNSIDSIKENIMGVGFGKSKNITGLNYPHNLILEIFMECGWIIGIIFIVFFGFALTKAYKLAKHNDEYRFIFTLMIFLFLNAMVSGDMNNRFLFSLIGLSLSYKT